MLKPNPKPNPQFSNPATTGKKKRTRHHHCYPTAGTPWPNPSTTSRRSNPEKLRHRSSEAGRNARRGRAAAGIRRLHSTGTWVEDELPECGRRAGAATAGWPRRRKGRRGRVEAKVFGDY